MIRKAIVDNKSYSIKQSNVLGSGGQATVVRSDPYAIKIYHQHMLDSQTELRLKSFLSKRFKIPTSVFAPLHIAHNINNEVVGFAMNIAPTGLFPAANFGVRSFREANKQYNLSYITEVFISLIDVCNVLHKQGIVIGDFNDLNILVGNKKGHLIDVDSFQFDKFPCPVATENYLVPDLYEKDLASRTWFKPEYDYYSLLTMLVKSITRVHPYGGTHRKHRTLTRRAVAKVVVTDDGVNYPKMGLSFDFLGDSILEAVNRMHKNGERYILDKSMLIDYRDSLIECNSCKNQFPSERNNCPSCSTKNTQQIHRKVTVSKSTDQTVNKEELISTTGNIIWHKVDWGTIYAIAIENNKYYLYQKPGKGNVIKKYLFDVKNKSPKFDLFNRNYLVVNQDISSDELLILDISGDTPKGIEKCTCSIFHGERMFSCVNNMLIRIDGGKLMCGEISNGIYIERHMCNVSTDQTWIMSNTGSKHFFIMERFFNVLEYSVCETRKNIIKNNIDLPKMDKGESIYDIDGVFSSGYLMLMIKTHKNNKSYTNVYICDCATGRILNKYSVESLSSDTHRKIAGKAFMKTPNSDGIVLHPTDDGIVQQSIKGQTNQFTLMSASEPFTSEDDYLIPFQNGVLVVTSKTIDILTIK